MIDLFIQEQEQYIEQQKVRVENIRVLYSLHGNSHFQHIVNNLLMPLRAYVNIIKTGINTQDLDEYSQKIDIDRKTLDIYFSIIDEGGKKPFSAYGDILRREFEANDGFNHLENSELKKEAARLNCDESEPLVHINNIYRQLNGKDLEFLVNSR